MDKIETATSFFKEGFNYARALLAAYGTELGLNREIALKIDNRQGTLKKIAKLI